MTQLYPLLMQPAFDPRPWGTLDLSAIYPNHKFNERIGEAVSYTHLDVYKRQVLIFCSHDSSHANTALDTLTVSGRIAEFRSRTLKSPLSKFPSSFSMNARS